MSDYHADNSLQQNDRHATLRQTLFEYHREAYEAFQGLGEVSEDLRVLSLNAELAAGRAGSYGVSIRALTQYTRELVTRLQSIHNDLVESRIHFGLQDDEDGSDGKAAKPAEAENAPEIDANDVVMLNEQAKRVADIVSQSNSIATNMAVEAATAGKFEDTFKNVANDMRGYVGSLKDMVANAQASINKAERALKELQSAVRSA